MRNIHLLTQFNNLFEYREWVNQQFENLSKQNQYHQDYFTKSGIKQVMKEFPQWFGKDVTFEELEQGVTTFKKPELLDKIFNQVEDKISTLAKDKIKAKKMKYNPFGLGVFVFDRASMGMFRIKEFYSPVHNKVVEENQVVSRNEKHHLKADKTPVIKRWEEKENGKPKIRTTSKNVYAYFPPVSKEKNAVDLFICVGGNSSIEAEDFLYSGVSAIIIAQLLEKAQVPTRISLVIGTSPDDFEDSVYGGVIPIKNFDDPLDINLIALLSSDPRFYRYEGFKGIVSIYNHFGKKCPTTMGIGFNNNTLEKTMNLYTADNPEYFAPNRFYFGRTFTEKDAIQKINSTIHEIANRI